MSPTPTAVETVEELLDSDTGRWQVTTAASVYHLNLDRRTATRIPGAGALADAEVFNVSSLEHDNETMALDEVEICTRGWSKILWIDPWPDGTRHYRVSTPVIWIRRLPDTTDTAQTERPGTERRNDPGHGS